MAVPFTSLDAATASGPGDVRDFGHFVDHHTMFVSTTGGANWTVVLEASHDGIGWLSMGQLSGSSSGPVQLTVPTTDIPGTLVRYVRANLSTLSGGTAPTVTATIASDTRGGS